MKTNMCTFGKKHGWQGLQLMTCLVKRHIYNKISGHEYTKWDVCDLWQAIGTLVGLWF